MARLGIRDELTCLACPHPPPPKPLLRKITPSVSTPAAQQVTDQTPKQHLGAQIRSRGPLDIGGRDRRPRARDGHAPLSPSLAGPSLPRGRRGFGWGKQNVKQRECLSFLTFFTAPRMPCVRACDTELVKTDDDTRSR